MVGVAIVFFSIMLAQVNIILAIVVGIILFLILSTVMSAAETIFLAAIYQRVNDRPTGTFNENILDDAFVGK